MPVEPKSPPYCRGHFSNGLTWVEDLATALKLGTLRPSLAGGNDFAYGGAESGQTLVHKVSVTPPDLPAQVAEFKVQVPSPAPAALYVLWIGSNDLFDMLGHTPALTEAQLQKGITQVVDNEVAAIAALRLFGMRNLLLLTAPDLGHVPGVAEEGSAASAAGTALAAAFDTALVPAVQAQAKLLGFRLAVVDAFSTMDMFIADPTDYGFSDVTDPCWTGTYTGTDGTLCLRLKTTQDTYLFWDHVHPTMGAHKLIAGVVKSQLP